MKWRVWGRRKGTARTHTHQIIKKKSLSGISKDGAYGREAGWWMGREGNAVVGECFLLGPY